MFESVLNHGFVRLVDSMGDDHSVVKSARVSYGQETKGDEADQKLIDYLMKHNHGTPFEHINFTFHIKCPLFVARQWFRHRIGSFNEISGRYVKLETEFWIPEEWRTNNKSDKQSSGKANFNNALGVDLMAEYLEALKYVEDVYNLLIEEGVAREQARGILPLATYTEFYWTVNARSLFNFLKLRNHKSAQREIRDYAEVILDIVKPIAPWTLGSFENYYI